MTTRTRLASILLVTGALAGSVACSRNEPAAYTPYPSGTSGGVGMGGYDPSATATPTPQTAHHPNTAPGSTTYTAPGNGAAGFAPGLNGNGANQGTAGGDPMNTGSTRADTNFNADFNANANTNTSSGATTGSSGSATAPRTADSDPAGTNASSSSPAVLVDNDQLPRSVTSSPVTSIPNNNRPRTNRGTTSRDSNNR